MKMTHKDIPVLLPFSLLRGLSNVNPLIVNYHIVSDNKLPYIENLYKYRNIKTFIEDLIFFCKKYHPIGLDEFLESVRNNTKLPKNSLLLTFDDGFREVYDIVAPICLEKKLSTTVFLTQNFIDNKELNYDNKKSLIIDRLNYLGSDKTNIRLLKVLGSKGIAGKDIIGAILGISYNNRFVIDELAGELNLDITGFLSEVKPYLTSQQIQELINAGFTIGSHSVDHARYAELTLEHQIQQTLGSTEFVVKKFGLPYRVFAFPYSDMMVSKDFFHAISGKIEASFGTSGLLTDSVSTNFQRISVEKLNVPASRTIRFHYTRKKIYQIIQKDFIYRE
ncbi:MAG: polysaccharide deacetylase family protein [Bacteroidales bacterium]|nr:polysaccharide deacetylase family protein [Bacteroidales bacterium]